MGLVRQIALAVLGISFAVFVSFFGSLPVFRRTPIGFLNRLVWIYIPNELVTADRYLSGGRLGARLKRTGNYLLYEKHPIVLIFFLALLVISELIFLPATLPLLPITFPDLSVLLLHYILLPLTILPPYILLHFSHKTSSAITIMNHPCSLNTYPFDYTIFYPPNTLPAPLAAPPCSTCNLAKPARSKHCSICRSCIQKADHHCIWINNCVGKNNYVFFLGLMLSVSILLAYGAYLGHAVLDTQIQLLLQQHHTTTPPQRRHWSTGLSWKAYMNHWAGILALQPLVAGPALLCLLAFPLAAGLTAYHVYLVWAGMTTNETGKWGELADDVGEGRVWRARLAELRESQWLGVEDRGWGASWPLRPGWVVVRMEEVGRRPRVRRKEEMNGAGDVGTGASGEHWEDDPRWTQVRSMSEIENVYDLGFWLNLKDVLFNRE